MQDHLLPLMTDPRFPEDTLFLVFEEDWRLYRAESQAKKDVVCEYLERIYLDPQGVAVGVQQEHAAAGGHGRWSLQNVFTVLDQDASSGPRKPSGAASSSSGGEPVAPPPFSLGGEPGAPPLQAELPTFYLPRGVTNALKDAHGNFIVSEQLQDIVRLFTFAHRKKAGDLVWVGWCGGSKGYRNVPMHGSQFIGITPYAANYIRNNWDKFPCNHFDVVLQRFLDDPGRTDEIRASYVYPSMGSYAEHESGCDPQVGVRASEWDASYVAEGTRGRRYLCKFGPDKGFVPGYNTVRDLGTIPFVGPDAEALTWKTFKSVFTMPQHLSHEARQKQDPRFVPLLDAEGLCPWQMEYVGQVSATKASDRVFFENKSMSYWLKDK